jgi:hypothetical protein
VKSLPHGLLPRPYPSVSVDEKIREDLITWIAEEALGGDREAAEWILLISISRVSVHPFVFSFADIDHCDADNLVIRLSYRRL